ncbi:Ysc84 actin-binding domain protein [Pseudohyphozyma bogoriensis]|nr:Ysc84 actin-binding domain protein [Pseudohyphozyma bogoriensis]
MSSKSRSAPSPPPAGEKEGWKAWSKRKSSTWGQKAYVKGVAISDKLGPKVNGMADKLGSRAFWPVTGDWPQEIEKCAQILRDFTVHGVEHTEAEKAAAGKGLRKQKKVIKKIPSRVVRGAKALVIYTSMRSGIAPMGGAGGAGILIARNEDGSWGAPEFLSPNNLAGGFMIGIDVFDAVLIIRTQEALNSFTKMKVTLGSEIGVAAGPYGAGALAEVGIDKQPVLSYMKSRGFYAGVEALAQVFVHRTEENEICYNWPGIKPADIIGGKVKPPLEVASLHKALIDAETGHAQRMKGLEQEFEAEVGVEVVQDEMVPAAGSVPAPVHQQDEQRATDASGGTTPLPTENQYPPNGKA